VTENGLIVVLAGLHRRRLGQPHHAAHHRDCLRPSAFRRTR
jgi:hypothetical protein